MSQKHRRPIVSIMAYCQFIAHHTAFILVKWYGMPRKYEISICAGSKREKRGMPPSRLACSHRAISSCLIFI